MKVYLVWSGIYESADVRAIFTTFDDAKHFVEQHWKEFDDAISIDERTVGGPSGWKELYYADIEGYDEEDKRLIDETAARK